MFAPQTSVFSFAKACALALALALLSFMVHFFYGFPDRSSSQCPACPAGTMLQVFGQNVSRSQGHKAQLNNITSAKAVSEIIRSTLGPCAMLKMILDPMGGIVMTNDGNCILARRARHCVCVYA